ncbi:MAG TPA: hypothetical protein VGN44_17045 [Candidatus Angelobacter sp.]|jgi:hypothetical protein
MDMHILVGQELALLLKNPTFAIGSTSNYENNYGRSGLRFVGAIGDLRLHIAQWHTTILPLDIYGQILTDPNCLDCSRSIIYYSKRRIGCGIRLEAWYAGQWYHFWIPLQSGMQQHESIERILRLMN